MRTRSNFLLVVVLAIATLRAPDATAASDDRLLSLVPADAVSVGLVRIDDMRRSSTAHGFFTKMSAGLDDEANRLLSEAGLKPDQDVDVIVVSISPSGSAEPRVLVTAGGRFDPARLGSLLEREGATRKTVAGTTYFLPPEEDARPGEHPAVCFYDRNLVIAGTEDAVVAAIHRIRNGGDGFDRTPLGRELFRIDSRASGWMLFDMQRARTIADLEPPGASPFGDQAYAAMKNISTISVWVAETSKGLEFGSAAVATDAETRALVADVLKGVLSASRMAAQEQHPELVKVIRRFELGSSNDAVTLRGSIPAAFLQDMLARMPQTRRP